MKSEQELIQIAEGHLEDSVADSAMKDLRQRFDETYVWCIECDGRVVKERDCCLSKQA